MDNPAAVLTDDVADWRPASSTDSYRTITTSPRTDRQHQYKRNVSTYSLDIPATMGLMTAPPTSNGGSTASSTMKLTEYSTSSGTSSRTGSVGDGARPVAYTIPAAAAAAAGNGINNGLNNGSSATGRAAGAERRRKAGGKKPPRYDPFQNRDKSKATTDSGALLHLIKSSLGSGILAMPNAFKNGGLIFGLVGTAAIGALCTHCIYLLVLCSQTLARRIRRPALGFADTAAAAFSTGPRRFRSWAPFAREFVNAALFCTYYFGNTVYVVLVAASFKQVADTHTPPEWHYSVRAWILGLAVPLVPLGIIRTLRLLVPFSAIATAFILIGLGCTMSWVVTGVSLFAGEGAWAAAQPLPDIGSRPWIAPIGHMPLFFATVLFAMEGIGTVLPIENSMRHPQRFLKARPCGVLNAAMVLVVCLYSVAGFLGYLRFGDATDGSITLNLPNDLFAEAVKIMVALSILFSYGLQFCVPSEIVWSRLEPWLLERRRQNGKSLASNGKAAAAISVSTITGANATTVVSVTTGGAGAEKKRLELEELDEREKPMDGAYYVMRATMILGTVFIAALVPDLAPFISLIGAVFFSILGLMCPAIIHLFAYWEHGDDDGDDDDDDDDCDDTCDEDSGDDVLGSDGDYYAVDDDTDLDRWRRYQQQQQQQQQPGQPGRRSRRRRRTARNGRSGGMTRWAVAKDVAIVLIALIALVSGTYASLVDIIAFYGAGGDHAVNGTAHAASPAAAAAAAAAVAAAADAVASAATTTIGPGPESAFLVASQMK